MNKEHSPDWVEDGTAVILLVMALLVTIPVFCYALLNWSLLATILIGAGVLTEIWLVPKAMRKGP